MNRNLRPFLLSVVVAISTAACAGTPPASPTSEQPEAAAGMPMGGGMMHMMKQMDEMHRQMERIQASTDAVEREKLMQEHMAGMEKMMGMMRGMHMMGNRKDMTHMMDKMIKQMQQHRQMMQGMTK